MHSATLALQSRRRPGLEGRWVGRRRANAILEMAIVLPMLMALVMGVVEFGQYLYLKSAFEAAARGAARLGIPATAVAGDPAAAATEALAAAKVTFNPAWMTIRNCAHGNAIVTDVSTVAAGDALTFYVGVPIEQSPAAVRPLYATTGFGLRDGKIVWGQCTVVKE